MALSLNKKALVIVAIVLGMVACKQPKKAEMYEASELAGLMREMVEYSKGVKAHIESNAVQPEIPEQFWKLGEAKATRDEQLETEFQHMVPAYLEALKGIQRGDSTKHFYVKSIQACKSCHSVYCGGPMSVIKTLDLQQ
jgi:hypothetical protein